MWNNPATIFGAVLAIVVAIFAPGAVIEVLANVLRAIVDTLSGFGGLIA